MPNLPLDPVATLRQVTTLARGADVLRRRGLLNPLRPDEALRSVLNVSKFGPFAGVVMHAAHRTPSAPAIVDELGTLTYGELDRLSNAYARGLAAHGLQPGSVVALLARDHRGMVLSLVAAGKLGVRAVLMNTGFAKPQFADVAARENVKAVLLDSEFIDLLDAIPDDVPRIFTWIDAKDGVAADAASVDSLIAGQSTDPVPAPPKPGGMVLLTSGTTGTPKGAPRDKVSPLQSAQFLDRVPLPRNGTMVMAAPCFHGTGLSQFTIGMALGNKMVLQQRRFDPEQTVANIATHRADALVVVPTMLQRIVDLPRDVLGKYDTSSLKVIFAAGSALSPDLTKRTAQTFGDVLYNLYGSTEVAVASVATPADLRRFPDTVGKPPVGCKVAIYDEQRTLVTEPGVVGTIFVSSGLSFTGYTDGRNKEIVDGMMSSGDVGHFNTDGFLFVDGRDDDMIVSGGENVFPQEVENLLAERPDVFEAAVIGVDDRDFGKRLRAFVVRAPESDLDEDTVKQYVKENLARYKVPREVVFIAELPRNATGKLLRRNLIEMEI